MRRIEITVGDAYVRKAFSRHVNQIPEDSNVLFFKSENELSENLVRRARCVLGFRGQSSEQPLNGNALQHALRSVYGGFNGSINVDEHIVAAQAVAIADETCYWSNTQGMNNA